MLCSLNSASIEGSQTKHMQQGSHCPCHTTSAAGSATEAAAKVQTKWEEEEARRDFFAVGGSHQQRSDWNDKLARSGDRQECMASCYPPIQAHNPVLICDKAEQLDPAQRL